MDLFNYPKFKITKPIRLIELFGGIGSQAMALRNIGANFTHHRLVEFDKYAVKSYNAIHGTDFPTMDITKTKGDDLGITDTNKYCYIMTYSFPCQDLSLAGKQRGMKKDSGTRSGLLWEVERLLNEVEYLPQVLLMENVPQVIAEKNKPDFDKWVEFLRSKGYYNSYRILNAKNYGVAQNRERCFMVSFLAETYSEYDFPEPIKLKKTVLDYYEEKVDEKYYLSKEVSDRYIKNTLDKASGFTLDKASGFTLDKASGFTLDKEFNVKFDSVKDATIQLEDKLARTITSRYYKGISGNGDNGVIEPVNISCAIEKNIGGGRMASKKDIKITDINSPIGHTVTCKGSGETSQHNNLVLVKQATKEGYTPCKIGGVLDLSYPDSTTRRGRVQDNGDVCPTLTARESTIVKVEDLYRLRKLTPRECWRLMGFSDTDFDKAASVNSDTRLYMQAGNSIVVNVLEALFRNMLN